MDLAEYLAAREAAYSTDHHMLGKRQKSAGYHTTVADGAWVHGTLDSLSYAAALLAARHPSHVARAAAIIRTVVALQDADPTSRTYGVWPYLLEEPIAEMSPPDWNWADFCGAQLLMMLRRHAGALPADLVAEMRAALGRAAWSIFRRNVGPGYTNIAIMGAGVALAAGELLGEDRLADYGRRRLANLVRHTSYHGGFNEYNSPCYTLVALRECERILGLVGDPAARRDAEALRRVAWTTIADHFHPGTGQWAGPHSRAYSDLLPPSTAQLLASQTGVAIGQCAPRRPEVDFSPIERLPCPAELVARFRALPQEPLTIRRRFIRAEDERSSVWGTTWFARHACLGSVSHDCLWTQRRCLVGYWRTPEAPAVVLRLRFLHDGRDFASACVRNAQRENRVLSLVGLNTDRGDWHISLDRPAGGQFHAKDFRVRYELSGAGAAGRALGDGRFELSAGPFRAIVHTTDGRFGLDEVTWQVSQEAAHASVDGICYHGPRRAFRLAHLDRAFVAAAIELLPADEPPAGAVLVLSEPDDRHVRLSWGLPEPLEVQGPSRPTP